MSFSNRAMAYLKLREFGKAEHDASMALALDPTHVKVVGHTDTQPHTSSSSSLGLPPSAWAASMHHTCIRALAGGG